MTLNYYAFTSSGGRHFTAAFSFAPLLANTWPVLLALTPTLTITPTPNLAPNPKPNPDPNPNQVLLVALSMWFSPWIFNPHSFQVTIPN